MFRVLTPTSGARTQYTWTSSNSTTKVDGSRSG